MKAKQLYYVLIAGFVVLVLAFVGVAYGANKLLASKADTLSKLRADSQALDETQTSLAKNKQDIKKYTGLNAIAETIVPQDKDQAEAVREIVNIAQQSGIPKLSSISFPASGLGGGVNGRTIGDPSLTQLTPVVGMKGLYELQITITQGSDSLVSYDQFITFLQKLEQNRRTAQVSSITVQPDTKSSNRVAFTLGIIEYIKP